MEHGELRWSSCGRLLLWGEDAHVWRAEASTVQGEWVPQCQLEILQHKIKMVKNSYNSAAPRSCQDRFINIWTKDESCRGTGKRESKNASAANGNWLTATVKNNGAGHEISGQPWPKVWHPQPWAVAEETILEKYTCTPNLWQHCLQETKYGSNQQGNQHRHGQQGVVHTHKGKAQAIRGGGKSATGSDTEGPREEPRKPSQSDRGRPIAQASVFRFL